jgi:hypothetical protein
MDWLTYIICTISAVSAAFIVSSEYIFAWLRKMAANTGKQAIITFVNCPVCLSWWFGLFSALFVIGFSWAVFAVAFAAALLARIIKLLEI